MLPPVYRSVPAIIGAVIVLIVMSATGFLPLFGGPGYESSLVAGLTVPVVVAVSSAVQLFRSDTEPLARGVWAFENALLQVAVAWGVVMVHGGRVGFCSLGSGLAIFALGPFMGALIGAVWGTAASMLVPRRRLSRAGPWVAAVIASLGPVGGVLVSLGRFYASPMVFAFDPFFGVFSGAIYDTVVTDTLPRLLTYRAGSLATLIGVTSVLAILESKDSGRLGWAGHRHPAVAWLAALALVVSLFVTLLGPRLGHWQTSKSISTALGGHLEGQRCDLVFDTSLARQSALLLRDCETQAKHVTDYFGLKAQPKVTVYVFRDAEQKRRLMGAAHTSIAKPWRREVYVVPSGYPHNVLGHELAHAISSAFGRGPFRIAGQWWGLKPNPGLIEGVAVAASPGESELSPNEWAAAMRRLKLLPPVTDVFALGFLGRNSSMSYTVAGAFVEWFRGQFGVKRLRRWYAGESLRDLVGQDLASLEHRWHESLDKLDVSQAALRLAKARFDRPGVFERTCPHAVDLELKDGRRAAGRFDCVKASEAFRRVLLRAPRNLGARVGLIRCLEREGHVSEALAKWSKLAIDLTVASSVRNVAKERVADLLFVHGDRKRACRMFREVRSQAFEEGRRRTLDVKLVACENVPLKNVPLVLMLMEPQRPGIREELFVELGVWFSEIPTDGLPAYLIGRNLMAQGDWSGAADYLDKSLARQITLPSVTREALRLRTIVACAQGDTTRAVRDFDNWASQPGVNRNQVNVLAGRLGECARRSFR